MKIGHRNHAGHAVLALFLGLCLTFDLLAQRVTSGRPGIDRNALDITVKPCQDFYQFANGNWLAHTPIPADRPFWAVISEVSARNFAVLHQIVDSAAVDAHAPKGSATRKVGDFWRSGMAEAKIEAEGARPLFGEFARIAAIKNFSDLQAEFARLHQH
ncbi:MAG: M13 family metallopeptidase, partial [Acidobacteriota bacterium]|nr:M13 family metallopeptidase [Acidobacteriota bacterium]